MNLSVTNTPEFKSYTRLTVVSRFLNERSGIKSTEKTSMSYDEFTKALQKEKPFDNNNSKSVSQKLNQHFFTQLKIGNTDFEQKTHDVVKRAYELGIVGKHDVLVDSFDQPSALEEISSNYNVRNATFEEISEISLNLYEIGKISFSDHAILSFDWNRGFDGLRQELLGYIKTDLNLTSANKEGRRDWIAEFEARMERDLKHNNLLGYENNKRVLGILKKLDIQ